MKSKIFVILFSLIFVISLKAQENTKYKNATKVEKIEGKKGFLVLNKITGDPRSIYEIVISGNKIQTSLWNYGSITKPQALNDVKDLVWNGLGYGYEFGLLAGAQVIGDQGDTVNIISDSHGRYTEGDYDPTRTLKWGWLPKPGYADPSANTIASLNAPDNNGDGKPDSWPDTWYSPGAGTYLWPAFLGDASTAPDEEVYFAIDDFTNYEFIDKYKPFPNDSSKGGLGLEADVRVLQFNNPLAEDLLFTVYQMTNASEKMLDPFYMGMYGDPHIGGASDYNDDMAFFIPPKGELADKYDQRARSMVYGWDGDGRGKGGKKPGYFGWKFLESPSIDNDNIDNDDDGIVDESPFNGKGNYIDGSIYPLNTGVNDVVKYEKIFGKLKPRWSGDEDGDWNPEKNDFGIDGIGPDSKNYPGKDYGEGDGVPSQAWYDDLNDNGLFDEEESGTLTDEWSLGKKWAGSEPNFGFRDISESDQLGLTGFTIDAAGANQPKEDDIMWTWLTKPEINPDQEYLKTAGDNIFCFSTGPMSLDKGESQRFSMVIILGEDRNDLLLNAITSVKILEADYQFAQPPDKPIVTAVSGDGKVTLYWDAKSEESIDPLTSEKDFEGYKIYRSRDFKFSDVYTVTDANGVPFLGQALYDDISGKRAQFDLVNDYSGLSEIEYVGRGVKYNLGSNTGLVHEYVDSTVQNGIKYYYAVVAYDRGTEDLPPTETQSVIQQDPTTGKLIFDVNTVEVIPGPNGIGLKDAEAGNDGTPTLVKGNPTGDVKVKVLEDLAVEDKLYSITFDTTNVYSILDSTGVSYQIKSKGTILVALRHKNIVKESIVLKDEGNNVVSEDDYVVNPVRGQIAGKTAASLPEGNIYTISYRYYPNFQSSLINNEDGNDVFEGLRVFIKNVELGVNQEKSRFITNSAITVIDSVIFPPVLGADKVKLSADWEIRWNNVDTTADGKWADADTTQTLLGNVAAPFTVWYVLDEAPNYHLEEPAKFVLYEPNQETQNNGQWDWGEAIILQPQGATGATTSYQINLRLDSKLTNQILPSKGDIYKLVTNRPFEKGDKYVFETQKVEFKADSVNSKLSNINVVPNPYVAYSMSENPGRTLTKRGERELQFRNLPPTCTIRIYTLTGELVDTIEKDDNSSIAYWNLLSSEGMRISYGVYIYHVEAPEVGEHIGRFGVIK